MKIKKIYKTIMQLVDYRKRGQLSTKDGKIKYFNFWDGQSAQEIWFSGFLYSRGFFERFPKANLAFFSTLDNIQVLKTDQLIYRSNKHRKRVFFTGENVHYEVFKDYRHNLLDYPKVDLSLGFDYIEDKRYLRFPIWLLEMFPPDSSPSDIKFICERLSHQRLTADRNRFCAMISGTSTLLGTSSLEMRTKIVESISAIDRVDCAGKLLRNTDELQAKYNDDKSEFLKNYKFFICPENISLDGYVTEKVFHSIESGCIPIYRGSSNNPEPDVLNHNAILFWEKDSDNMDMLNRIRELYDDENLYKCFYEQPRLQENAWEVVVNYFDSLEQHFNNLFKQ